MISMQPFHAAQTSELAELLSDERWPFHAGPPPSRVEIADRVRAHFYAGPDVETWWIFGAATVLGLIRLYDLGDDTAMFDLRLRELNRGRGLGTDAVRWLGHHIFTTRVCTRIEATTRADNVAMRRALLRCGYAKESHYRAGWPDPAGGAAFDAVGYALLRTDWESGTLTPVDWDDEPLT